MFNAKKETEKVITFIREYYQKNHLQGVIIGISGGKDSAVVAALFVKALGKENVIGLTLPCHSKIDDEKDAQLISDCYGFPLYNFDLTPIFDTFKTELAHFPYDEKLTENSDINLKPRLRMATLYYFAALFTAMNERGYLVAGTSNKCERYVGYFTKGGDSVHDIAVLADFTVEEVIQMGEYLQVPKTVLFKTPADGLSNLTDEEKLGVTYQEIANYMIDPEKVDCDIADRIERLHTSNQHKFFIPTYVKDSKLEESL